MYSRCGKESIDVNYLNLFCIFCRDYILKEECNVSSQLIKEAIFGLTGEEFITIIVIRSTCVDKATPISFPRSAGVRPLVVELPSQRAYHFYHRKEQSNGTKKNFNH